MRLPGSVLIVFPLLIPHALAGDAPGDAKAFFESKIRPVLVEHCYKCHSADSDKIKGGLRVDYRDGLLKGGKTGPAVVPNDVEKSLLIQAIRQTSDELAMPPKSKLSADQIANFEKWVRMGAPDPRNVADSAVPAGPAIDFEKARAFWSFHSAQNVAVPKVKGFKGWDKNPIDAFVVAKLKEHRLTPAQPAEKRTLIRRATFDLTGLPPTPEEIDAFLNDRSSGAYEKLIERLLNSPAYGERWGRHWLDVARYADTAGDNSDFPIPTMYRYRNYVIDSFNNDTPYDQFIQEQLAGDLMPAKDDADRRNKIVATGFIALSRRFGSSRDEAPQHLVIEDTIDTMSKSILGLSLSCSRCHDHKFDPITMADYYGIYGVFDSTRYPFPGAELSQRPMDLIELKDEKIDKARKENEALAAPLNAELTRLGDEKKLIEKEMKTWAGQKRVLSSGGFENGGKQALEAQSVELAAGEMLEVLISPKQNHGADTTIVNFEVSELKGAKRRWNLIDDVLVEIDKNGAENPRRDQFGGAPWYFYNAQNGCDLFSIFKKDVLKTKGLHAWNGAEDLPSAVVNTNDAPIGFLTVKMPPKTFAIHPSQKNAVAVAWECPSAGTYAIKGEVVDADSSNGDGIAWSLQVHPAAGAKALKLRDLSQQIAAKKSERDAIAMKAPAAARAYAVAEGKPRNAKIQKRGDPTNAGPEVPRRFLQLLGGQTLPADAAGSGRLQLAEWLTSPSNPLTARVMANRIWQHHFGKGLVATPNDFGTRGVAPTHPELLDYLAQRFVQGGWSVKSLHRLIMTSQTYQQSSNSNAKNEAADPANDWLWKFSRQRLDAESIRDAMLFVSETLESPPGGPHPFPAENTWKFTQHDPFTAVYESKKRSVYLMQPRIRKHPFLALFDGADPNATTGLRLDSTTPIQALFMMNDSFVHECGNKLALRMINFNAENPARISYAYRVVFGRPPLPDEAAACEEHLKNFAAKLKKPGASEKEIEQKAWASLARVLLSSNEFVFVE